MWEPLAHSYVPILDPQGRNGQRTATRPARPLRTGPYGGQGGGEVAEGLVATDGRVDERAGSAGRPASRPRATSTSTQPTTSRCRRSSPRSPTSWTRRSPTSPALAHPGRDASESRIGEPPGEWRCGRGDSPAPAAAERRLQGGASRWLQSTADNTSYVCSARCRQPHGRGRPKIR